MLDKYKWYQLVNDDTLEQGDIFFNFPILEIKEYSELTNNPDNPGIEIVEHDVILMTQSCDLFNEKIADVILCPHNGIKDAGEIDESFKSRKKLIDIIKGRYSLYSMLNKSDLEDFDMGLRIVHFGSVFSASKKFVTEFASKQEKRIRLCPPYREHLSQNFARIFMRVGLPQDIQLPQET